MRSENSVKNSLFAVVGQAVSLLFGFITRRQFVRILGEAYLGVNGVFCSVLSLLSLTELGLGSAITYALYRPLADKDDESAGRIMNLFAFAYRIVAAAVMLLGLCLMPFLGYLTKDVHEVSNLPIIYILFLVNSAASYLFSYRRALITASERDWRNSLNLSIFSIIQNAAQLFILVYTSNYILYLVAQLVCTLASNIEISHAASKMFPFIGKVEGLPVKEKTDEIKKNVKAMFVNRFGGVAVTGTDNLLIASIDVILVGLYSNYLLILQTIQVILAQVANAVTASVGNLIASDNSERRCEIYKNLIFVMSWMYGFSAIALDCLLTRFITIFFGEGLSIPEAAVHIMSLNFYLNGIRQPNLMYINAAGLFRPIRFKGFVEAAINLGVSALFMLSGMGLFGVLLGTTVSHFATSLWWEPYCVDRNCLGNGSARSFAKLNLFYGLVFVSSWVLTHLVVSVIPLGIVGFFIAVLSVAIIPNIIFLLLYHKTEQFCFIKSVLINLTKKS
jgi:O-antigen/teichoic acid export membrane protein